jgi:hypothetical protein
MRYHQKNIRSKTKINGLTQRQELSTIMREQNRRSPKPSCDDQLVAIEINGKPIRRSPKPSCDDQLVTIEMGASHGSDAVSETDQPKQFIYTVTSTFTIQDQHVSDRKECDREVN